MFGYVRPLKDELKVREYDQFKACYCALCHTLKSRYGAFSRNILNFDFTFLTMLLWDGTDRPAYQCARCVASPLRKKTYCAPSPALDLCAGYSVILAWWKLRDSVKDETFFVSLGDRLLSLLLRRAYKKASRAYPAFDETVRSNLEALGRLESAGDASLDACADKFAAITEALAAPPGGEAGSADKARPLRQLLYHTGRYIYITDACDDLEDDLKKRRFNPVANRFGLTSGVVPEEDRTVLRTTLMHSCALIGAAYELLPKNYWAPVLSNIIYLGMPETCFRVLDGTWRKGKGAANKGMDRTI
ncbi:hypothetical protein SAMN02745823_00104 [Sporobacter termitidis DSM 10068]|uniref:Uncharacterized protein n=1 Tax=Sporobacter termitidis DSM 10068 TaxID=1123282 RepID=A0A1M5TI66_9FIRM|nr:DUF5685 family protein [Sporobacter termitidis]SHH50452.1 hypothetical protein SAMN02745823_00104 [Sporobacter termitidis DSM 10068]